MLGALPSTTCPPAVLAEPDTKAGNQRLATVPPATSNVTPASRDMVCFAGRRLEQEQARDLCPIEPQVYEPQQHSGKMTPREMEGKIDTTALRCKKQPTVFSLCGRCCERCRALRNASATQAQLLAASSAASGALPSPSLCCSRPYFTADFASSACSRDTKSRGPHSCSL